MPGLSGRRQALPAAKMLMLRLEDSYVKIKEENRYKMTEKSQRQNNTRAMEPTRVMKPLSELNLLDRFLFDEVMEDAQTAKDILEIILEREAPP